MYMGYNTYIINIRMGVVMSDGFKVSLADIMKELSLNILYMPVDPKEVLISSKDVNRLGVELMGFLDYFDNKRILIIGNTEVSFLARFESKKRLESLKKVFSCKPPAVIVTRNLQPPIEILEAARIHAIPILSSVETTSVLTAALLSYMNIQLAPRITRHGVLVEVYGEGVFITGDSGVGKSETAIELIKRGHRLVADDAVEIRKVSKSGLVGSSPENIRHFIELRGIGIINARRLFGMGAVKLTEKIDFVIKLESWDDEKIYDRMGSQDVFIDILGVEIPVLTIPIKPGRNLAVIIEVAAMNNRQKKLGYNAAQELLMSLGMDESDDYKEQLNWNI